MKLKLTTTAIVLNIIATAQVPIGNPPAPNTVPNNANSAWYRGGNFPGGTTPVGANIFGTMFNSPVYHYTAAQQRMVLNGNVTSATTVGAGAINKDGFLGINHKQSALSAFQ